MTTAFFFKPELHRNLVRNQTEAKENIMGLHITCDSEM